MIIVRSTESLDELRCGGALMVPIGATESTGGTPSPEYSDGTLMGKRYTDDSGAEVLVTRAGVGTLSVGETRMALKEAKPLPASD